MRIFIDRDALRSLLVMGAFVEARDAYTAGHLWRVSLYARLLGERAGLTPADAFLLGAGGFLHDVGKIGIPDAILANPGRLNPEARQIMESHPLIGHSVVRHHPMAPLVQDVILQHHERMDGQGYPGRLSGDRIGLYARIVAIADAFDAMTNARPYRERMSIAEAQAVLRDEAGRQFDADLVAEFLRIPTDDVLSHVVAHSEPGSPLVDCPTCGPILALPRGAGEGETIACRGCQGVMVIQKQEDRLAAIFTGDTVRYRPPGVSQADLDQIDRLLQGGPDSVEIDT